MSDIPVGFKFKPSDEELVGCYLRKRLCNQQLPRNDVIFECDIYGPKEPWEIWQEHYRADLVDDKDKCIYVFTHLRKGANGGPRVVRQVGTCGGTWHGEGGGKPVRKDGLVWFKRWFKYKNKNQKNQNVSWVMQEFSIEGQGNDNNLVLCKISRKEKLKKREEVDCSPSVPSSMVSSEDFRASKRRKEHEEVPSSSINTQQMIEYSHVQDEGNYIDNRLFHDLFLEGIDFLTCGTNGSNNVQDLLVEDYGVTDTVVLSDFPRL